MDHHLDISFKKKKEHGAQQGVKATKSYLFTLSLVSFDAPEIYTLSHWRGSYPLLYTVIQSISDAIYIFCLFLVIINTMAHKI